MYGMNVNQLCQCQECIDRRKIVSNNGAKSAVFPSCAHQRSLSAMYESEPARDTDSVVEANRQLLLSRSQLGIKKYGTTLEGAKLSRREHLQHALEEALDLANYLQAEIIRIDRNG